MAEQGSDSNDRASSARGARWHSVKVRAEDFAILESEGRRRRLSTAALVRELIEAKRSGHAVTDLARTLAELRSSFARIEAMLDTGKTGFHSRIVAPDGERLEDFDRRHWIEAVITLRELAHSLVPRVANELPSEAQFTLTQLNAPTSSAWRAGR